MRPGALLTEELVEKRAELRLRKLHHAAFLRMMHYDPNDALSKLTRRLFDTYRTDRMQDKLEEPVRLVPLSSRHVERLNLVGESIVRLHETFLSMGGNLKRDALASIVEKKDDDEIYQLSLAAIELFDQVHSIHEVKMKMNDLKKSGRSAYSCLLAFSPAQARLRLRYAMIGYARDGWNVLNLANYCLLLVTILQQLALQGSDALRNSIAALGSEPGGPWGTYIDFRTVAFSGEGAESRQCLLCVGALLTWVGLVRYLEQLAGDRLTARKEWLLCMACTIVVGSSQGAFLLSRTEYSHESSTASVLSLLRGNFGEQATPSLLLWIYMILAFAILLSLLITATIASSSPAAAAGVYPAPLRRRGLTSLSSAVIEAQKRVELSRYLAVTSPSMNAELQPFADAVESLAARAEEADDTELPPRLFGAPELRVKGRLGALRARLSHPTDKRVEAWSETSFANPGDAPRFRTKEAVQAPLPTQLSFKSGDIIIVTDRESDPWRGYRQEDGPTFSGDLIDRNSLGRELLRLNLDLSSSDDEGDVGEDDWRQIKRKQKAQRADAGFDTLGGGEESSEARSDDAVGRALAYSAELKETLPIAERRVGRDDDPTRSNPSVTRSAVQLEMDESGVAERRYRPSTNSEQSSAELFPSNESLVPIGPAPTVGPEPTGAWLGQEKLKQQVSALTLSVVPDLQDALHLLRQQSIEQQQATRAQMMLAEEVQQLRHELLTLSTAFDRRVPEPPAPGEGWERKTHDSFSGREYWHHEESGTTSWDRPPGVPTALEEMNMRKANAAAPTALERMQMRTAEDRSRLELKGLEAANAAESAALPGQLQVLPAKSPARAQG